METIKTVESFDCDVVCYTQKTLTDSQLQNLFWRHFPVLWVILSLCAELAGTSMVNICCKVLYFQWQKHCQIKSEVFHISFCLKWKQEQFGLNHLADLKNKHTERPTNMGGEKKTKTKPKKNPHPTNQLADKFWYC